MRETGAVEVRDAAPPRLDLAPVRAFWNQYFGIGRWPVEDIYYGLAERFVRRVRVEDARAFEKVRGRAVLYLANHQVGTESLLFSVLASGITGIPTVTLAKAEHRESWLGRLIQHAWRYPGAKDPGVITYFDRSEAAQLPQVIAELGEEIRLGRKSVMVHIEGTRALSCRAPVAKLSGAFVDMAIATGAAVVPVRFVGGLPVEPLAARIEFPIGMGQQDVLLGRPLLPEELAALPYKERKERVVAAINALGTPNALEAPLPGDSEFAGAVRAWMERTGATEEHATVFETLRRIQDAGPETRRLLEAAERGRVEVGEDALGQWHAELARRLFGPRGPEVVVRR